MDESSYPVAVTGDLEVNRNQLSKPVPVPVSAVYLPRSSASSAEEPGSTLTSRLVIRAILQWWYVAAPVSVLLAAMLSALVFVAFTPVYRASALLQIASHAPYLAYESRDPMEKPEEFVQTQIELLRSPLVLEPVLAKPEISDLPEVPKEKNAVSWLAGQVKVTQVGHSELFQVSVDGPDPQRAATLINAVVDSYFDLRARDDASRAQRVIELLEEEKQTRAQEVARLRANMHQLSKEILGKDPFTGASDGEAEGRHRPLESLVKRLTEVEVDRKVLEVEIRATEEALAKEDVVVPNVSVEMALGESPEIKDLRTLIATKRGTLHRLETVAAQGKDDPAYLRLEREIKNYEQTLERAQRITRPNVQKDIKEIASLQRKDDLAKMQSRLESQRVLEQMLRERYDQQLEDTGQSGNKSLELEFTRAELARAEKVFEMIAQRSMALNTEMRAPGRVTLMKHAAAPLAPLERIPLRNLGLVLLASFCLPFGLAVAWEHSVRRISDTDQLVRGSELAVLGEVARLPLHVRRRDGASRGSQQLSLFEESIDSLRVCLVLPEQRHNMRVLAVCSAVHGEGKTSVSSQLAVSIARASGEPTLLIDADMRSPDIHRIFDVPNEPGLSKVLDRRCSFEEAVITTWSDYIHLLPAGRLHKSPFKLLGGESFQGLIRQVRARYRYVVVDTPPILSAAEALLLAKAADGTLLCTMRNYSREAQVRLAQERLVAAGVRPLGTVFNAVPTRRYAYRYGSYGYDRQFDQA